MASCETLVHAAGVGANHVASILNDTSIIAACLQADATVHAARIGATAARQAGTMGLFAGFAALMAAAVAYLASKAQVRLLEQDRRAKIVAYRRRLKELTKNSLIELSYDKIDIEDIIPGLQFERSNDLLIELSPENWERHSTMGSALEQIDRAYRSLMSFQVGVSKIDVDNENAQHLEKVSSGQPTSRAGEQLTHINALLRETRVAVTSLSEALS